MATRYLDYLDSSLFDKDDFDSIFGDEAIDSDECLYYANDIGLMTDAEVAMWLHEQDKIDEDEP